MAKKVSKSKKNIKRNKAKSKLKAKTDLAKSKKVKIHPLSPFWEKVEHINSKLIPYAVFALTIIIIVELFVDLHSHFWEEVIHIADVLIIIVFVIDLFFIFYHVRKWSIFFRRFWLDILAVFPFVLFFRGLAGLFRFFRISEQFFFGQTLLHEGLEVRKAAAAARTQKFAKYLRMGARGIRVVSKSRFFTAFKKAKRRKN
tara:strand:+ start:2321 stop:2920 length:600 start_codon:yes stop_codon:yes gene_type:complete